MAFVGDYAGQWVGEWLGQALNPGAMYANLSGDGGIASDISSIASAQSVFKAVSYWLGQPIRQTKEQIRAERERMGIIPKRAMRIIKKVAREAVEDAETIKIQRLIAELEAAHLQYEAWYSDILQKWYDKLLREEIQFLMQKHKLMQDEEEIALVLLLAA